MTLYDWSSTIMTRQMRVKLWHEHIGNPATAVLDRRGPFHDEFPAGACSCFALLCIPEGRSSVPVFHFIFHNA